MAKTFTLTAANAWQIFSGDLGQTGWAPDPTKAAGAPGNVLNIDNMKRTAISAGTPGNAALFRLQAQ